MSILTSLMAVFIIVTCLDDSIGEHRGVHVPAVENTP